MTLTLHQENVSDEYDIAEEVMKIEEERAEEERLLSRDLSGYEEESGTEEEEVVEVTGELDEEEKEVTSMDINENAPPVAESDCLMDMDFPGRRGRCGPPGAPWAHP